jgi:hypothetical protein
MERKSFVSFETELEILDIDYYPGVDKDGNSRIGIDFSSNGLVQMSIV